MDAPATTSDQSIFISDVQTGAGSLLAGAEGGNDPAWSPDGEKVAFDDWHVYPQSIYTVPSGRYYVPTERRNLMRRT